VFSEQHAERRRLLGIRVAASGQAYSCGTAVTGNEKAHIPTLGVDVHQKILGTGLIDFFYLARHDAFS
jgi:hypothetical protein